ncbi:MAG TPA: cupin domain-containing protein [Thermoanaerobaculia bacterium]|nr:cupin domain-containing protein [Thermoanaerobaculia bacterium]
MKHDVKTFGDLIAPLSAGDFFASYWEKGFLHLQNEPDRFSGYFSLRDVDGWLTSTRGRLCITAPEGDEARTDWYQPQEISMSIAYAAFARGCSLVLDRMEDRPSLQGLAKALGRDFHADVGMEAFLTPQGAKTFPTHAAGHDLLILQLEGEKIWQLHEFSLLQLNPSEKTNFKFPLEWYGRTKTPVIAEVCLKPGDVLYIPRGMPYQAVAQNGACLHLYVTITPLFWMDFLKVAAECAALHSQDVRRALPPGFVESQEICEQMRSTFQDVMKVFQEVTSFDEVLAAVKRNRVKRQDFPQDGHFTQLLEPAGLTVDSEVERRRNVLCFVEEIVDVDRNTKSAIFFGKERVTGPRHLRRALEFIRDQARFRVSEVPGLDEKSQLTLVRRLITEGLLRRALAAERIAQPTPAVPVSS